MLNLLNKPIYSLISFLAADNKDSSDGIEGSRPEQEWYLLVAKNIAIQLELFQSELASNFAIGRKSTQLSC